MNPLRNCVANGCEQKNSVFAAFKQPRTHPDSYGSTQKLGDDEAWCVAWLNARKCIGETARDGDRRVGERCGGGEPIGSRDIEPDRHRHSAGIGPQGSENGKHQPESCHRFRKPLRPAGAGCL